MIILKGKKWLVAFLNCLSGVGERRKKCAITEPMFSERICKIMRVLKITIATPSTCEYDVTLSNWQNFNTFLNIYIN
jgi:hypothetical protein